MRLCRFAQGSAVRAGFFFDSTLVPLDAAARLHRERTLKVIALPAADDLLALLPGGSHFAAARELGDWLVANLGVADSAALAVDKVQLLTPIPRPPKIILLAGNYNEHIKEGGGQATERAKTFPYLFQKPPTTTLNHPGAPIVIPKVSPNHVDWECELGVVIAKRCKAVKEAGALGYVAGYTVVNDISDRKFRPNPGREKREKDSFFDWQHGKWHDTFCPVGPCVSSAHALPDPQKLGLTLKVNGKTWQNASTAQMIFPVAAIIEFVSAIVTLEPGDIISTGTPSGVGNTTGTYLKHGDQMEAAIEGIGVLRNHMVAE
ncbi:MAG: 2-keto-4-pentenoate hydratase [Limisphaerales bacterium]|nr:MAG: 2-keto-4-pentenoate hydratase [Limisphaerales bacterium]KAG0507179.1 MAG: 2-keto-4-pentenoate hydratase [Limisphaerales bacterium]TXT46982.1 MAG: 2-keto-4-pentenoate hydratase [Limisphaerales bacterium]